MARSPGSVLAVLVLAAATLALTASSAVGAPAQASPTVRSIVYEASWLRTTAQSDMLVRVQQHDLDVQVIVHGAGQQVAYAAPAGRTGQEWIYLTTAMPIQHQVYIYPAFRHAAPGRYEISILALPAGQHRRADLHAISEAGRLWATRTLRMVAGVLRLRPTKRGTPAVTTAPTATMSPLRKALSASV